MVMLTVSVLLGLLLLLRRPIQTGRLVLHHQPLEDVLAVLLDLRQQGARALVVTGEVQGWRDGCLQAADLLLLARQLGFAPVWVQDKPENKAENVMVCGRYSCVKCDGRCG